MEAIMIKRILIVSILSLAILLTLTVSLVMAQQGTSGRIPQADEPEEVSSRSSYIPIQGRLTNSSGNPLNGTFLVDFKIYDKYTGGIALCENLDNEIQADNGLFNGYMDMQGCGAFDGRQLYLGLTVEDDPEMTPRQYIDNVPYAWSLRPGAVISATSLNPVLAVENWADDGRGLRAYAMSQTGVNYGIVGASRSPDGFGGYFYNNGGGTALKVSSADGVAITADGVINSTAPTYLWVSGNDVRPFYSDDTTIIDLNSHGGAQIKQGADVGPKSVVLPITIAGTLYGQDVKLTGLDIYWQGDTEFDAISTIRLRRQTGACGIADTCYLQILVDTVDKTCENGVEPDGCIIHYDLTTNNILNPNSGILYLTVEFAFGGASTWIDFGGARLTLEYNN
jgi:hypothetical protein